MSAVLPLLDVMRLIVLPVLIGVMLFNSYMVLSQFIRARRAGEPADWYYFRRPYKAGDKAGRRFMYTSWLGWIALTFYPSAHGDPPVPAHRTVLAFQRPLLAESGRQELISTRPRLTDGR
jgi:hypothetical protein